MISKILCAVIFCQVYVVSGTHLVGERLTSPDRTFKVCLNYEQQQVLVQCNGVSVPLPHPFDQACLPTKGKISSCSNFIVVGYTNSSLAVWQRNNNSWELHKILHGQDIENSEGVQRGILADIILVNELGMIIAANAQGQLLIWELVNGEYQLLVTQVAQEPIIRLIYDPSNIIEVWTSPSISHWQKVGSSIIGIS